MLPKTPIGTIEGFFGNAWSHQARCDHIDFLADQGASFYIYAPKNDPYLRRQWQDLWPSLEFETLRSLRRHCAERDIAFGVGISPFGAHELSEKELIAALKLRLTQINQLNPDIVGIFFDDMRGDTSLLAEKQLFCAHFVQQLTQANIIFCPTYYSFDPVLEKVFGQMPHDYFDTLRQQLHPDIDIFWTGEKVCSRQYPLDHLHQVRELLGRQPFIWDNYPVNDGAVKSQHLHLSPVDHSLREIFPAIAGRAINPMNQAYLSQIAMSSSICAHHQQPWQQPSALSGPLYHQLQQDINLFESDGLSAIPDALKENKQLTYKQFLPNPFAQEVIAWLNGEYTFDPACLTD